VHASTERVLDASPNVAWRGTLNETCLEQFSVKVKSGKLTMKWKDDVVEASEFEPSFLRAYAPLVAKELEQSKIDLPTASGLDWLKPYDNTSRVGAKPGSIRTWKNDDQMQVPPVLDYNSLTGNRELLVQTLLKNEGVVIIDNMPDDPKCDGSVLEEFGAQFLGGLQKHPLRETAHWTISTEHSVKDESNDLVDEDARKGANSYNTDQQLCNHTDQSLYGLPGVLLMFHCAWGEGTNSLTDGFAVAEKMRKEFPEYFDLLSKHGMTAGRALKYYSAGDLNFTQSSPIISTDADGNLIRVQYHEIYRAPSTLSFDDFPKWFAAYNKFYELVHNQEFKRTIKLKAGQLLIMNNWRVMHGRAGLKGKARTILGGTVNRDAFYSAARTVVHNNYGVSKMHCGAPMDILPVLGLPNDQGEIGRLSDTFSTAKPDVVPSKLDKATCDRAMQLVKDTADQFSRVDKDDEPPFRVLEHGLPGEACAAPSDGVPPYPHMIRRGDKFYLGYRFDQDVCDKAVRATDALRTIFGEADKEADAFFRLPIGYAAKNQEFNGDRELANQLASELAPHALRVFGEENNPEASTRVYSMYCNALLPGHVINNHLDVAEFYGVDRSKCPNWLLVAAHCSGLFGPKRARNATAVFYPRTARGGDLAVYGPTDAVYPAAEGHAVVFDADSAFHHSAPVHAPGTSVPPPAPKLPANATLRRDGDAWVVVDEAGCELSRHAEEDIRWSISCKFHVFKDKEELEAYESGADALTAESIIDRLTEDLRAKGKIPADEELPLYEIGPIIVKEYVAPLAPTAEAIEKLWLR
jgi:hypothetical protein